MSVWFYTVKTFELLRLYRIRVGIVERARREAVFVILEWIANRSTSESLAATIVELANSLFHQPGKAREELLAFLQQYDIDEEAITVEAVRLCLRELESIDRSIALTEASRSAIKREMLLYRQELGPRLRELEAQPPALIEHSPPTMPERA